MTTRADAQDAAVDVEALLGGLPHFRGLPRELLARVAACCVVHRRSADDVVFRKGERCDGFWVVAQGAVRLFRISADGREQVLHHSGPGSAFAEAALFHLKVYPAEARAEETPTTLVQVRARPFLALFEREPLLARTMIASLCSRMHSLVDRIELLTTFSAGARLARYLLQLPATDAAGAPRVELPVTKRTLASEMSITPETLSRLLARWRDRGLVETEGRALRLLDVTALQAVADGNGHGAPAA